MPIFRIAQLHKAGTSEDCFVSSFHFYLLREAVKRVSQQSVLSHCSTKVRIHFGFIPLAFVPFPTGSFMNLIKKFALQKSLNMK